MPPTGPFLFSPKRRKSGARTNATESTVRPLWAQLTRAAALAGPRAADWREPPHCDGRNPAVSATAIGALVLAGPQRGEARFDEMLSSAGRERPWRVTQGCSFFCAGACRCTSGGAAWHSKRLSAYLARTCYADTPQPVEGNWRMASTATTLSDVDSPLLRGITAKRCQTSFLA
jgi:hypothetical protein